MILRCLLAPAALLLAMPLAARACDLALALAVDVSGSIDPVEYRFQMQGLASALEDPTIADALVEGQVALSVIQWSGTGEQVVTIPWRRMQSLPAVAGLAQEVRGASREWNNSKTAIGDLIGFAVSRFSTVPDCRRRVIDISGDGQNNDGSDPLGQRALAQGAGITINGLAIDRVGRSVTLYYRNYVIAGRDAFVHTATGYRDYPRAIRRKLIREILRPSS